MPKINLFAFFSLFPYLFNLPAWCLIFTRSFLFFSVSPVRQNLFFSLFS
jgi:hypothetical protein